MPVFEYIAISDTTEKSTKGTLSANDKAAAVEALKKQHLRAVSVTPAKKKSSGLSFLQSKKVKSDDLVIFTRQLSAMIGAGVPLLRALSSLEQHAESPALKAILVDIIDSVQGGSGFGDALAKHPDTFSDIYVNMVRAGEAAGILDDILKRLAIQQEKSATIRKKVKSAMTYPMVLLVITVLAFFGLMLFVIPQIGDILKGLGGEDAELPVLTQFMLALSGFIISFWYIIIPVFIAGVIGFLRYIKTPTGRKIFHQFILKVPAVGPIIRKVVVARFARTFSALIGAGVSIIESMTITAHALGNTVYEQAMLDAVDRVKNGEQLSHVIDQNPLYPSIVAQMLSVGEETGQTETVLVKVADFYDEEVDTAIGSVSSIIEPVMIVLMGGMVGLIAASVMGPIAGLAQNIQG
tara:strand:- start:6461 stop:7684 length:1224 start_codon:yes stop_codon:yes gene_type:complete